MALDVRLLARTICAKAWSNFERAIVDQHLPVPAASCAPISSAFVVGSFGTSMDADRLAEILKQAAAAVNKADLPPELHAPAFEKAVDLLGDLSGQGLDSGADQKDRETSRRERNDQDPDLSNGISLEAIATKTEASIEDVEEAYGLDSGELKIIIPGSKLAKTDAGGSRQLAILVVAGRAATGLDPEWTASEEIREVCRDFGVFDSANFSSTIKALSDEFRFTGTKQGLKVRMTRKGWEAARDLIAEIAGGAS